MEMVKSYVDLARTGVNGRLDGVEPWKVVAVTAGATYALVFIYNQLNHKHPLSKRLSRAFFPAVRKLPFVRQKIEAEMAKVRRSFRAEFLGENPEADIVALPERGMTRDQVHSCRFWHLYLQRQRRSMPDNSCCCCCGEKV